MYPSFASPNALALLSLGFIFGLKHATEVDHLVAVSTLVSRHRTLWRSALVGAMWGVGHTATLLVTGTLLLAFRVAITEKVSNWLEFAVALMILGLGASAMWRALKKRGEVHLHKHTHDGISHVHVHFHEPTTGNGPASTHSHAVSMVGLKPVLVGMMHGLAGSGALALLVLTQIRSAWVGLLYLAIFGLGSIVGMLLMSGLIGLPFALTSRKLSGFHHGLETTAAGLSIAFGLWYVIETSFTSGLF